MKPVSHLLVCSMLSLLAMLPVVTLRAQVLVGYCPDVVATTGLGNNNASATISCAAAFTADDKLVHYQACDLGLLKVGISATEGLTSFKVWVREHLRDENLVEVDVPVDELVVGWNEVLLPQPLALAGHDTLYCGYDYTQSVKNVHAISYGGNKKTPLSFWIANSGKWRDYTSNYGPLSLYAGIVAKAEHGVRLDNLRLSRRSQPYLTDPSQYLPIVIEGTLQNLGSQPLTDVQLQYTDNGQPAAATTLTWPEGIPFGQYAEFSYSVIPGQGVASPRHDIPLCFTVEQPNADAEAIVEEGMRTLYYDLYDRTMLDAPSVNLVEEFTSERSGFAPEGQHHLREAVALASEQLLMGGDAAASPFVILSHHQGFGPADAWRVTQRSDYDAVLFGPDRLAFAPAALVNRRGLPFSTTMPVDSLVQLLLASPLQSYATISAEASCTDGVLSAVVKVRPCALTFCANPQLLLCLVQDEVASVEQKNYYPDVYDSSLQHDVIRCYLHNVSGNDALLQGADMSAIMAGQCPVGDYASASVDGVMEYHYEGTLPADLISLNGCRLVAYIYDKGNTNCIFATYVGGL